jgi:hypothetical protein
MVTTSTSPMPLTMATPPPDVYYDPFRCGHQADIVKVTDP